jgi:hypothetical protein
MYWTGFLFHTILADGAKESMSAAPMLGVSEAVTGK